MDNVDCIVEVLANGLSVENLVDCCFSAVAVLAIDFTIGNKHQIKVSLIYIGLIILFFYTALAFFFLSRLYFFVHTYLRSGKGTDAFRVHLGECL